MNDLKNKNIIVTGASGGIGNSIVKKLNECGANILASGTRLEKLEELNSKYKNINTLIKHDYKKIYKNNLKKKKPNIVGYDIKWENPIKPNLEIKDFFLKNKKEINFLIKSKIFKKLKL